MRNSSKNPDESVLSTLVELPNKEVKFGHFKIRNIGQVGRPSYQLELAFDSPSFSTVELLLTYYTVCI